MSERASQVVVLFVEYNPVDEHTEEEMGARKDKASNWNWTGILNDEDSKVVVIASGDVLYFDDGKDQ